jgi:geranylgeranyl diphosphate synthase type I
MTLDRFASTYLPGVESSLRALLDTPQLAAGTHYPMMAYHLGWLDEQFEPVQANTGKGIRPLLCLLSCAAAGGDPQRAVAAAAAVEMLHNFSLVHDDVEDASPTRRHRPTVWQLWGEAQAINVGDGMFALVFESILRLAPAVPADVVLRVLQRLIDACLALTEGQHLDLAFEARLDVTVDDYLTMVRGKTAALLAACTAIGALLGGADPAQVAQFHRFGENLGLAFQVEDDILGIWGDERITGKSAASDILARKKSLPVLFGLAGPQGAALRPFYTAPELTAQDVPAVLQLLHAAGARAAATALAERYSQLALEALDAAQLHEPAAGYLHEMALRLLRRNA